MLYGGGGNHTTHATEVTLRAETAISPISCTGICSKDTESTRIAFAKRTVINLVHQMYRNGVEVSCHYQINNHGIVNMS